YVQTELGGVALKKVSGEVQWLAASTPDGRIWILDQTLGWTRDTNSLELPPGSTPKEWYANTHFGLRPSVAQVPAGDDNFKLWVYENYSPYRVKSGKGQFRLAGLNIVTGAIDHWVADALPNWIHRNLAIDSSGVAHYFQEVGDIREEGEDVYLYSMHIPFSQVVVEGDVEPRAGFVFEFMDNAEGMITSGHRLGGFEVPVDPDHWQSPSGSPWPYVGESHYSGQVTATSPLPGGRWTGNAVKVATLRRNGQDVPHVIVGTFGGLIYAIDISQPYDPHLLSEYSLDQGWGVLGLDAGNLDGDEDTEILAGILLDKGNLDDYTSGTPRKNCGKLLIFDFASQPGDPMTATPVEPDYPDPITSSFAAGVLGVRIDDINADGKNEIWCGDGLGRVYVFARDYGGAWHLVYRTKGLGPYPGYYNKIFPVKIDVASDPDYGCTSHLAVATPGYIYRFEVKYDQIPWSEN
ncbi:MAG: hypothetical protein AB1486_34840, partial [Planctomycetota bacterium]